MPWITNEIKRNMRKKDRLYKKAVETKDPNHWSNFKKQRNLVSKLVKHAHDTYLNEVIGPNLSENPKKFWSYVRRSRSEDTGIPPLEVGDAVNISDKDKAETLNISIPCLPPRRCLSLTKAYRLIHLHQISK